jgi:hypothetical protein
VEKTRGDGVFPGGCIGKTISQRGHADLIEENGTFTHMISHVDLASGEWPRVLMFSIY